MVLQEQFEVIMQKRLCSPFFQDFKFNLPDFKFNLFSAVPIRKSNNISPNFFFQVFVTSCLFQKISAAQVAAACKYTSSI